ncbi:MAG: peptide transporter permease [Steroidobacteraceae bacterium]|nr:peptide transporter permease [Steroidobacteraceae bacterium]
MKPLIGLAARSLWNRRGSAALTVFAIAISVMLLVGVETVRNGARESFARTISGTDLIVGARSGPVNLLLYSVFRIGDATTNVSWQSFELVSRHPDVAWTIPISLGDSHRGYRVMGTNGDYFRHYRYGNRQALALAAGKAFEDAHDAVVGAEVARQLGYRIGDEIMIAHGIGEVSFAEHGDHPFRIAGILGPTGTPVDRTVHVSLDAIAGIHEDWQGGTRAIAAEPRHPHDIDDPEGAAAEEAARPALAGITAFLVGMRTKDSLLQMQRALNEYRAEPLTAVIPGVALQQLWQIVNVADRALFLVATFVVLAGLIGMLTAILTSLRERRREMAILRSVGARPMHVFTLLMLEASLLALAGVVLGITAAHAALASTAQLLASRFGLFMEMGGPGVYDLLLAGAVVSAAVLAGLVPAWLAYRNSLADGLTIRT